MYTFEWMYSNISYYGSLMTYDLFYCATDSLYKPLDCHILLYSPQMLVTVVKIPNKLSLLKISLMRL